MNPHENRILDLDVARRDRDLATKGYRFKLLAETAAAPPTKQHIIKGIFARGETSAWIGPPGSLKSALLASAMVAVASGQDWFGRRNKERCGAIYFALERADLVERRLQAMAPDLDLPIAVVRDVIDLLNGNSISKVVATVREAEQALGLSVGLLAFDTLAKLISAGGGDEDKARDQGRLFANIQRIKNLTNCHAALVGHTGKDESRGARGSNAVLGDVDLMVTIGGDEIKTATVTKANDAPEGPLFSFKSKVHEFGLDEDGDPITVNVVCDEVSAQVAAKPREPKLSTNQRVMLRLLSDAGPAGLTTEAWGELAKEQGITIKQRQYELRMSLKDKGLVREYNGIWHVNNV
ncbi:AAA family ATPase [Bradyrhizobium tunisiense]|uniref:AAA family ATPase n=1 Tax=Bradyrhizobium tunisiense TaxID=3278709 RepID=UPI0035E2A4AE